MDPVFTIQYPEFILAQWLQEQLPKSEGYSVMVPLSRQEKDIDLAILRKSKSSHKTITIQIKASRTYSPKPPKRATTQRYKYYTWFNRFEVPETADFILLFGLFAPDVGSTTKINAKWYQQCTMVFTKSEMKCFLSTCLTTKGKEDSKFGFGFNQPTEIFLTRGNHMRKGDNFSDHLLERKLNEIRISLNVR